MILVLIPILFLILFFYNFFWKRRNLPPGPTPLPLLGNTLTLRWNPPGYSPYQKWAKEFGPVYTFWMGETPIIVVTDYQIIKETFLKDGDAYAGRHFSTTTFDVFRATNGSNHGVIRAEGNIWRLFRRFTLHTLRNLGLGKTSLENKILEDVRHVIRSIEEEKLNGIEAHNLAYYVDHYTGSIINDLLFGYPFVGDKMKEYHEFKRITVDLHLNGVGIAALLVDSMPWLRHFPYFSSYFKKADDDISKLYDFVERNALEKIAKRKANNYTVNLNDDTNKDFVDIFLDKMEVEQSEIEPDQEGYFNMDNLRALGFDLFIGGQETSANTLNFLFLYLLLDQRVQRKLCAELDKHIITNKRSQDEYITSADRTKLPYLNAVINETQRLCNLFPSNLPHRTTRDVVIKGFKLPKGTNIVPQMSTVHYDEKIFPNPEKFIPERFIDENGQLKKCEELIPFSIGKRQCAGEPLAKIEIFLLAANFLNKFEILPVDPLKPPSTEKQVLLTVLPQEYKCRIEPRH